MIVVLKKGADEEKVDALKQELTHMGLQLHLSEMQNVFWRSNHSPQK